MQPDPTCSGPSAGSMQSHAAVKAERKEVSHDELVSAVETVWQHSEAMRVRIEELQAANEALTQRVIALEGGWSDWDNYRDYWRDTMLWIWSAFSGSILHWSRPREVWAAPEDTMQDTA